MHNNSLALFKQYGLPLIGEGDKVLEVGPDWSVPGGRVKPLLVGKGADYHFTDIVPRDVYSDGYVSMSGEYAIDVDDDSFDAVVTLNVIEHVRHIWNWVWELRRVVRQGGLLVVVNPLSWPYHPSPYDCWRILPEGFKALFESLNIDHEFSLTGNVAPLESYLVAEHGPQVVTDTIAIGRKPKE